MMRMGGLWWAITGTCRPHRGRYKNSERLFSPAEPRGRGGRQRGCRRIVLGQCERWERDFREHRLTEARLIQELFLWHQLSGGVACGLVEKLPHLRTEFQRAAATDGANRGVLDHPRLHQARLLLRPKQD